jgi:adenosine deaminase
MHKTSHPSPTDTLHEGPLATPLADLHLHVGGAVAPHVLWSIAHQQGYKLPAKNYWEFAELVTASPNKVSSLDSYLHILHTWTEKIQSSPAAIERSVYEIIGKEYRSSRVELLELRFNPMKRNEGGERDLDHIIHAALRGMDRACLEYNVRAGLIFCLAREFSPELNEIILKKAIRYRGRGVVGIDLAGTEVGAFERSEDESVLTKYSELFARARDAGLGTTVHTGETLNTDAAGVARVIRTLRPDRIGHGIRAAYSDDAMEELVKSKVVLEICPSSNLATRAVSGLDELGRILRRFMDNDIAFTINTDGTYLLGTNMKQEIDLLVNARVLSPVEALSAVQTAYQATFIPKL